MGKTKSKDSSTFNFLRDSDSLEYWEKLMLLGKNYIAFSRPPFELKLKNPKKHKRRELRLLLPQYGNFIHLSCTKRF